MSRPDHETLIAFLEETLSEEERAQFLRDLQTDPALAAELERAAAGLDALKSLAQSAAAADTQAPTVPSPARRRVSPWWAAGAAAALALAVSIPMTLVVADREQGPEPGATQDVNPAAGPPQFVLVLRGRWSDVARIAPDEFRSRIDEYWAWTSQLADDGVLVATSELALDMGEPSDPAADSPGASRAPPADYVVGMFTLRMNSYQEALAVARSCPHLRFGGSVTVQRVAGGFVTVSGMRDWTS